MKQAISCLLLLCLTANLGSVFGQTPMDQLHGDQNYSYSGLHSGNQFKCNFYNDGMVGKRPVNTTDIGGEWPINSGHKYTNQQIMFVGAEVKDENGETKHIVSEGNGCTAGNSNNADSGDSGANGEWYTWAPLPGFANDNPPKEDSDEPRIAMSQWKWSWPATWPDKFEDPKDPGWPKAWNGYFGKDVLNADQESYYVMDDYNNREFAFYPDSTNLERRGLGLRTTVRGFQWSNVLVEDILFLLYDVKNIGTTDHDKLNFGIMSGPVMGDRIVNGGDGSDDGGEYSLAEAMGYHLDQDDVGAGGWNPVGFMGLAFFESPGNPYDGIDDDGDAITGPGPGIDESLFAPKVIYVGDPIVLINYQTFERTLTNMPAEGVDIEFQKRTIHVDPEKELVEVTNNLFDDNLNGLIDENNGSTFGTGTSAINRYLYLGQKYINYFTGDGRDNPLIDEKRDDGIDNDHDWNPLTDDVGMDGVANTGDLGEGDGLPTSGRGTDIPGEPNIDKTDVHESDMIGLTAFNIYTPWTLYPLSDDENLWTGIQPGYLNAVGQFGDTDILMGSGYFPLKAKQIERFSLGVVYALDKDELFRNKKYAQKTYDENYNFSKAPMPPTVKAIPGDNQVTLIWDALAEKSFDPISGYDFEGYRIYRSTDPGFNDMTAITDQFGSVAYRKPLAQFDLIDNIKGSAAVPVRGIHFWMGDDTGLKHLWVDSTAQNGQKYYYAVTSYDKGSDSLGIAPTECSKYISITPDGKVDKGKNVVIARPEAPSAGYVEGKSDELQLLPGGQTSGSVSIDIADPSMLKDGHVYHVTFEDTLKVIANVMDTLYTKNVNLIDITNSASPDTLVKRYVMSALTDKLPFTDGFELTLLNVAALSIDTSLTKFNNPGVMAPNVAPYAYRNETEMPFARDLNIVFGDSADVLDSSRACVRWSKLQPAMKVNFTVLDAETGASVPFGFYSYDGKDGQFSRSKSRTDEILIMNRVLGDTLGASLVVKLNTSSDDSVRHKPGVPDTLKIRLIKPFLAQDVFEFTMRAAVIDSAAIKSSLANIKVVPNPYVVANSWEPQNPYSSGRGPRELHFTHLPPKCTIKIFNLRGHLVATLEHDTPSNEDGTEIWDMLSKDKMDIAYGLYVYHVDAGKLGRHVGKFAVIK